MMESIDLDGVKLTFVKLTLDNEKEWAQWLRSRLMADAKADADALGMAPQEKAEFLAAVSAKTGAGMCGIITQFGMDHAMTPEGMMQLLRMASRQHHPSPGIDDVTLYRLIGERSDEVARVIRAVLPIKEKGEKKATTGGLKAGPA